MRILVADDDAMSRTVVAAILRNAGYDVDFALDGNDAWATLQRSDAPSIAIIDWDMPGLEGVEICRRLRATDTATPAYVILLTSRDTAEDMAAAFAAGADDYVVKPPRHTELLARIRLGARIIALQRASARNPGL
jgi:DNA-binding response OmpR family regulator